MRNSARKLTLAGLLAALLPAISIAGEMGEGGGFPVEIRLLFYLLVAGGVLFIIIGNKQAAAGRPDMNGPGPLEGSPERPDGQGGTFGRVMAVFCAVVGGLGFISGISYSSGAIDSENSAFYALMSWLTMVLGAAGAIYIYLSVKSTALAGKADALLGPAGDERKISKRDLVKYDHRTSVNGYDMLVGGYISSRRGHLKFNVCCLLHLPAACRITVYPGGFWNRPLHRLTPPVPEMPGWEGYSVRSDRPAEAARILSSAREGSGTVFDEKYGFRLLELEGDKLECSFICAPDFELHDELGRQVMEQLPRLAALIERGANG